MKKTLESFKFRLAFLFFALMNTAYAFAQEEGGGSASVSVSKTTTSSSSSSGVEWYTNPWVWVVGGAVFILLLIALLRGNSSSTVVDRTGTASTQKTTITRTDETISDA